MSVDIVTLKAYPRITIIEYIARRLSPVAVTRDLLITSNPTSNAL